MVRRYGFDLKAIGHLGKGYCPIRSPSPLRLPEIHSEEEVQNYFAQVLDSQECWLDHLYVAPKFQNLGIGSALLEIAKTRTSASLELWAFQGNHRAREFYAKDEFIEVEWTDGLSNEEKTPDVRLIWRTSGLGKR